MKKLINKFKNIFVNYPVTYISSILIGLSYIFLYEYSENLFETVFYFLLPFGMSTFLVESKFKQKLYAYLCSGIVGTIFGIFSLYYKDSSFFIRALLFYVILMGSISFYSTYKKSGKSFPKYLINVFSNILEMSIIYFVLNIGVLLILLVIDYLFVSGLFDSWIENVLILLLSTFYVPSIIYSLDKYSEVNKFINILVTRVLFTLVLITYFVVYAYLFKIIITGNLPSNVIFRIISILFIISTIVFIMGKDNEKNKNLAKIYKYIVYVNIPLIILQIYSLVLRINSNGITIVRYLGIALIIFETVYTILEINKKDLGLLLFVVSIEMLFALVIPYINCYDFSINYQFNIIKEYKENGKLNNKVKGAYDYLLNYDLGKEKVNSILNEEDIKKIDSVNISYDKSYFYSLNENKKIDVKGYNYIILKSFSDSDKLDSSKEYKVIYDRLKECTVDRNMCFDKDNRIVSDDDLIIIKDITIDYNRSEIIYYYVDYYLLSK